MDEFKGRLIALWSYRGFVVSMVAREFRSRYLGSLLGSLWAVLHPMALITIYTVIFSKVMRAKLPGIDDTMAYGLFVCAGLLPWLYFVELLNRFPNIFIEQATLLKKVSFPRITLPVIALCSATINFLIIFSIFISFLLITGRFPGWIILAFIPLLMIQQTFVVGIGVVLGSVNVFFRDIGQFVSVIVQFWFWFTPIVYAVSMLPEEFQRFLPINPMTAFVQAYQAIILYDTWPNLLDFKFHILGAVLSLIFGFAVFHRLADEMVDEL
ncbi:MAG: ABC transporter permease [Desulfopila sp.]|jgi:lipopolysaccharide transport system permease protein|nr:ABC transporter permease [Desulfopila sp.]